MNTIIILGIAMIVAYIGFNLYKILIYKREEERLKAVIEEMEQQILRQGEAHMFKQGVIDAKDTDTQPYEIVALYARAHSRAKDYLRRFPCTIEGSMEKLVSGHLNGYEKQTRILQEEQEEENVAQQTSKPHSILAQPTKFIARANNTIQFPTQQKEQEHKGA